METKPERARHEVMQIATAHPDIACESAQALTTDNPATPNGTKTGASRATLRSQTCTAWRAINALLAITSPNENNMEIRVAYEHSLASAPEEFIVQVPAQLVTDIPANVPRALLPEFVASLIIERSPTIGKIRNLRIL